MADVAEPGAYPDAATAISQGKRHLLVQDYTAAVTAFAEGLEMMSQKLGECDDELGEPYLLYGRALLGLAREEAGVLGGGVPGSDDAEDEDENEEDDGDDEKMSEGDDKTDETEETVEKKETDEKKETVEKTVTVEKSETDEKIETVEKTVTVEKIETAEKTETGDKKETVEKIETVEKKSTSENKETGEKIETVEKNETIEKMEIVEKKENDETSEKKKDTTESITEKTDEKINSESIEQEKPKKDEKSTTNETDDKKLEEEKLKNLEKNEKSTMESVAGSSKLQENGTASTAEKNCNGKPGKSEDAEDGEDVNKEDDDEDPGRGIDLQVAWEVLELAKIVFTKRGEGGLKKLAETHRLLGEVAMESDNPQGAITDLENSLKLLQKVEPCEPRAIAELHYQLGLAHSLLNDFDASIGQFNEATTLLEARIKQLEDMKDPTKTDDPFYTVEGEIKELMELLPAIQEKITDMKDFKEEACRLVIEGIKNKVAGGGCTNGAGSSTSDGASSSSAKQIVVSPVNAKPASDISHLVRKKRKAEDSESPTQSPCKKPTP